MPSIEYTPPPTVKAMLESRAVIRAIHGPLGSGKSAGCVMALTKLAAEIPPDKNGIRRSRFAIIRNTARMLQDTTQKTVFDWLPPGAAGRFYSSQSRFMLKFGDVESEWIFRPLDHPDDVRNLLSLELTGAWLNEYREIHPDILINLLGRLGRFPRASEPHVIMDTNPPPQGSYWHSLFENQTPEQEQAFAAYAANSDRPLMQLFKQPGGRSPQAENLDNLPRNYYDLLIAANADRGENWVNVHVDAQYGEDPNNLPVYPEFRHALHVAKAPLTTNPKRPLCIGMDFGRTPSVVVCQQTPQGQWIALDEFVQTNCGLEKFLTIWVPWMKQRYPEHSQRDWQLWPDPSGKFGKETDEKTCFKILQKEGFTPLTSFQIPEIRQGSVRRCLTRLIDGEPGLVVSPTCRTLVRGFAGEYAFKRNNEGDLQPHPRKNYASHCLVAGTLVDGVAIESLRVGDRVHTPWGKRRVTATMSRDVAKTMLVTTRAGRRLRCSVDHPFYSGGCFVRADALQYGDTLNEYAPCKSIPSSSLTGLSTIANQVGIINRTIIDTVASTRIGLFGLITTGVFRRGTNRITSPTTLSAYQLVSTPSTTSASGSKGTRRSFIKRLRRHKRQPPSGIGQRRGANGTSSTAKTLGRIGNRFRIVASSVAWGTRLGSPRASTAAPTVRLRRGGNEATIMYNARASTAERRSQSISMPENDFVIGVAQRGPGRVYDITVEQAHCFYAEGILVSNCHDALQYVLAGYEGTAIKGGNARKPEGFQTSGGFNKPIVVKDKWSPW